MAEPPSDTETARLEALIPAHLHAMMQKAARLRGMTLTAYLIATVGEDARRVIESAAIIKAAREDQVRFARALIEPAAPNERLARAQRRHADLIEPR